MQRIFCTDMEWVGLGGVLGRKTVLKIAKEGWFSFLCVAVGKGFE